MRTRKTIIKTYFITEIFRNQIELITSVKETKCNLPVNLHVYPNPVDKQLNIDLNANSRHLDSRLQIFKSNGTKIFEKQITGTGNTITVNVKNLNTGIYVFKLINTNTGQIKSGKFIKN